MKIFCCSVAQTTTVVIMYYFSLVIYVITIVSLPRYSAACNGYVLKFHYLKHCADENVITFKDATSTLDKDCNITPHGCVSTNGFKTAMMHYRAEKKPLPAIEGEIDLCKALEEKNEYALLATGALGLPQTCPVGKQKVCSSDKKVNISKYKTKLGMALGVSTVNITITHDTGITCLSFKTEFLKPRRMG